MLVSAIKSLFFTKFDQFSSAYWSNAKLNDIYSEAQAEVSKDLISQYQISSRVTEDALFMFKNAEFVPSSNEINLDTDPNIVEYNTLINVYPAYNTSGGTIQWAAKPFWEEDRISVFAKGSRRYPRFDQYTNSSNERILRIYPEGITPDSVWIAYFRNPYPIDFNSPSDDIPVTNNYANLITDKAIQLASAATRDSEGFQEGSALIQQANTIQ